MIEAKQEPSTFTIKQDLMTSSQTQPSLHQTFYIADGIAYR